MSGDLYYVLIHLLLITNLFIIHTGSYTRQVVKLEYVKYIKSIKSQIYSKCKTDKIDVHISHINWL